MVGGYGPYTPIGSDVLFNSLPCNKSYSSLLNDSNSNSDLNNLQYVATNSFNISSSSSMGSARVASGDKPTIYGPDRWTQHLEGQTSRGDVDILGPITDEERSAEVLSDADTDKLLSLADDEESEVTLSEDSNMSQGQIKVIRAELASKPQSPQSSSSPSSISGISPVVPVPNGPHRPIVTYPPFPSVCTRPRLPTLPNNYFSPTSPPLFRPTRPPFPSELPRSALPFTRATAPRLSRPLTPARTLTPSELSRPALPFRATTPRPVRPAFSVKTRPFSTPRPKSKQKYTMPPPPSPYMPSAAPLFSTPKSNFQPPAAPVFPTPKSSFQPSAAPRPPTPLPASLPSAALPPPPPPFVPSAAISSYAQNAPPAASPPQSPMSICSSPTHPAIIQNPPPPGINVMEGRTLRVDPTENIGPFAPAVNSIPVLGSFSVSANMSRVPVMNQHKQLVPSKSPKFPALSPKSKLNIYISSQHVHNLPSHMEQVFRVDLTLDVLLTLVKYDLDHIPSGCKLSFIVVDFVVSKQQSIEWHRCKIFELIDLLHTHPAGNVIRFGQVFIYPSLCIPETFTKPYKLANNYLPLVTGINTHIISLMSKSCSRSTIGSIGKHVGITVKGKNWRVDAWENYNPSKPSSIIKCSKLTPPYQKRRSFTLLNQIESEIRGLPDV